MRRKQLFQLILIQFREFYREPGVLFWAFGFPILMAWGLGLAFKEKPDIIRKVAVIENALTKTDSQSTLQLFLKKETKEVKKDHSADHSHVKDIFDKKLGKTTYYFTSTNWNNAILMLKRGQVTLIMKEENGKLTYHFDPASPEARLVQLQLESMIRGDKKFEESPGVVPLTLSGTRYIDFLIPGLIAMSIMMSCMWGISWTIIDNRSKKLLRRMVATPMKKSNFLVSLFVARLVLSLVESLFIYLFAHWYFGMTIQGSITALIIICITGNIAFTGIAVLAACHTSKPEIGNGIINAVTSPMMVISGIFFSYANFPDWAVPVIKLLPLTMLADITRSIFNEGAGLAEAFIPATVLTSLGLVTFGLGLRFYKWY